MAPTIHEYFTTLGCALLGKQPADGFLDASGNSIPRTNIGAVGMKTFGFVWSVAVLLLLVCNVFGAVHLSWCYNKYIGTPTSLSIFYGVLCFFFPMLYYPFYGVFLDPLCGIKKTNGKMNF